MFGIDLFDAALVPAMFVAITGGLISFASPCVLPIVPPYLAYMGGVSMEDMDGTGRKRVVLPALYFVLGLSTVFILLGFAASSLGRLFIANQQWFVIGAGVVVTLFGLHFLHILRLPILDREARVNGGDRGGSSFGAYILGLAFAFGWTPCLGPILGAILALAADTASPGKGMILLALYAAGLGVPFILVALFFPALKGPMAWMKRHLRAVEKIMGGMLVLVGVMMMTGQFTRFSYWLLEQFPALGAIG